MAQLVVRNLEEEVKADSNGGKWYDDSMEEEVRDISAGIVPRQTYKGVTAPREALVRARLPAPPSV